LIGVVEGNAVFTDYNGVQTRPDPHDFRLAPGQGGNTAGLEAGFAAEVTAMDNAILIGQGGAVLIQVQRSIPGHRGTGEQQPGTQSSTTRRVRTARR
jgi:hypothetical protein